LPLKIKLLIISKYRAQNKGLVESGGDGELDIGMKLLIGGAVLEGL